MEVLPHALVLVARTAPEVLKGGVNTPAADMWQLYLLSIELCCNGFKSKGITRQRPYGDDVTVR